MIRLYLRHSLINVFNSVSHCKLINNFLCYSVEVNFPRFILNHISNVKSPQTIIFHEVGRPGLYYACDP